MLLPFIAPACLMIMGATYVFTGVTRKGSFQTLWMKLTDKPPVPYTRGHRIAAITLGLLSLVCGTVLMVGAALGKHW